MDHVLEWEPLVANLTWALLLGCLLTRFLQAALRSTLTRSGSCATASSGPSVPSGWMLSVEAVQFVQQGRAGLAAGYAGGSVVFGLIAAAAGLVLGERWT